MEWRNEALVVLKDVALKMNCTGMYGVGRLGWKKALKSLGFEYTHTVLSYNLGDIS